jgi:Tfp pilus assembly protein PilE
MINRQQQRGVTLVGMLLWGIVIVFVALVAMKLVPAYTEYFEIRRILKEMGGESSFSSLSNAEIRDRFERKAMIDNITAVKPADLQIGHVNGRKVVSVDYTFQTELIGNVSLLADFSASSDSRESKMAQQVE